LITTSVIAGAIARDDLSLSGRRNVASSRSGSDCLSSPPEISSNLPISMRNWLQAWGLIGEGPGPRQHAEFYDIPNPLRRWAAGYASIGIRA